MNREELFQECRAAYLLARRGASSAGVRFRLLDRACRDYQMCVQTGQRDVWDEAVADAERELLETSEQNKFSQ